MPTNAEKLVKIGPAYLFKVIGVRADHYKRKKSNISRKYSPHVTQKHSV